MLKSNFTNAEIGKAVAAFSPTMVVRVNRWGNIQISHPTRTDNAECIYYTITKQYRPEGIRYRVGRTIGKDGKTRHPMKHTKTFNAAIKYFNEYLAKYTINPYTMFRNW